MKRTATDTATIRPASRQRIFPFALILLLALLLVACRGDAEPTPVPQQGSLLQGTAQQAAAAGDATQAGQPAPTPTPFVPQGNLVLWHSWAGADADALTAILTRLKAEAPLLNVETLFVAPNDLPQAYADAVLAGGGPDVAVTQNWWISDLVEAQVVRPLDPWLHGDGLGVYNAAAASNFRRDGAVYGLPATFETVSLFYNRSLASPAQVPATTDALLAQSQLSTTLGIGLYANLYHDWWGFPAYGAQLFDDAGKVILDQSAGAADYLAWIKALRDTSESFVDTDYGMLIDRFKKGEFAFFVDGPWAIAELRAALGDALSVVPLPAGPAGPAQPWLSADGVIINPRTGETQAQLGFFLATRLTDAAAGSDFATIAGRLPAHKSASLPDDPVLAGFMAQAATAQPAPWQPEMDQVWGYGGDMLVKVLGGSVEPAAAVQETAALINDETGR